MAPPILIRFWVTITVYATLDAQEIANVFSFQSNTEVMTEADCLALATGFWAQIGAAYTALCTNDVNFTRVVCSTHFVDTENHTAEYQIPQPHPGTAGGDCAPSNACAVLGSRSGLQGRDKRGRTFVFSPPETLTDAAVLVATYVVDVLALGSLIFGWGGEGALQMLWTVASRKHLQLHNVISWVCRAFVNSQRNRLPFHRRHKRRPPTG